MKDKLVLGSANFGLAYGIANKQKLDKKEVFDILRFARSQGVWGIDTAKVYGDAEDTVGEFFKENGKVFHIITKLPRKEYRSSQDVDKEVTESLQNMGVPFIDFLLVHSYESYKLFKKILIPALRSLQRNKIIGHFGISIYYPDEAETILQEIKDTVAIEFPLNLFDQRFLKNDLLKKAKDRGNFLFARSVFLQGLFFLSAESLVGRFSKVGTKINRIKEISNECHMRPQCLAILFVVTNPWIDKVIIGVDSNKHLIGNLECFGKENAESYEDISAYVRELEVADEDILLPFKWET